MSVHYNLHLTRVEPEVVVAGKTRDVFSATWFAGLSQRLVDGRTLCKRCDYDGTESSSKHRQEQRETAREFDCQDDSSERGANDGSKESGHTNDRKVLRCRIEIRNKMRPHRKEKSSGLGTHSEHRRKETSGRACRVRDGTKKKVEEKTIAKCSDVKSAVKNILG